MGRVKRAGVPGALRGVCEKQTDSRWGRHDGIMTAGDSGKHCEPKKNRPGLAEKASAKKSAG